MTSGSSLRRNVSIAAVERLWVLLSRFLTVTIIARVLGPVGQAVYSLALSVIVTATLPFCGFDVANNFLGNRHRDRLNVIVGNALLIGVVASAAAGIGIWVAYPGMASTVLAALPPSCRIWLPLMAGALIFDVQLRGLITGADQYGARLAAVVAGSAIFTAGIVGAAALGRLSRDSLMPLYLAGMVAGLVLLTRSVWAALPARPTLDRALLRTAVVTAVGPVLYRGSNYLNYRFDVLIIGAVLDSRQVGLYALASSIVEGLTYLPKGVSDAVVTQSARAQAEGSDEGNAMLTLYHALTLFSVAVGLAAAIAAPWVIPVAFTREFRESVWPLVVLLPGSIGLTLVRVSAHHLIARGHVHLPSVLNLASVGAVAVLDLMLVPRWGIISAAAVFSLSYSVLALAQLTVLARDLRVSTIRLLVPTPSDLGRLVQGVRPAFAGAVGRLRR